MAQSAPLDGIDSGSTSGVIAPQPTVVPTHGKIAFDLVSPERLLLSKEVDMVTVPGTEGYMGVMAGHAPVVTTLRTGMIDMQDQGVDSRFFILGGFAEISATKITVLADRAMPMSELDLAVLDQMIADAQEDEIAAKNDIERQKAAQEVDDLKLVRAAF
jgi:F-type H+-transporting ATPase subunit epsilon